MSSVSKKQQCQLRLFRYTCEMFLEFNQYGILNGMRCFHYNPDGTQVKCDCKQIQSGKFKLSPKNERLFRQQKLSIDFAYMIRQQEEYHKEINKGRVPNPAFYW
jgi:hypothetical protein